MKPLHVYMLLDETGSMSPSRDTTISAINEYIDSVANGDGDIKLTLRVFSSVRIQDIHKAVPINSVEHISTDNYKPAGVTPLYDALGSFIKDIEKRKEQERIVLVVMTDGFENASSQFTQKDVFKLIKKHQEKGCECCGYGQWTFVFLGANQDSWATGSTVGLHAGNVCNWDTSHIGLTMKGLAADTLSFSASNSYSTARFIGSATLNAGSVTASKKDVGDCPTGC